MFNLNPKKLHFQAIQTRYILDLLKNCDIRKGARIDDLSGRFCRHINHAYKAKFAVYPSSSLIF